MMLLRRAYVDRREESQGKRFHEVEGAGLQSSLDQQIYCILSKLV